MSNSEHKSIVVYFSHTGENYFGGKIVDLSKGNTEIAAERIASFTGADMFEIKPKNEYPFNYNKCTEVAKAELRANTRPEIVGDVDLSGYDTVFLGYPNWWGTIPCAVMTFLEKHDWSGKTVLPFCTNEGSRMGTSEKDIKTLCVSANVKAGLSIFGSQVKTADESIKSWLEKSL